MQKYTPGTQYPFNKMYPFYAMVEIASCGADTDEKRDGDLERMMDFLDTISDHIIDGVVP